MKLEMQVVTSETPEIGDVEHATGWGELAKGFTVTGQVKSVEFIKDGKAQFGLYLRDDGSISLTCYESRFSQFVGGLNLKNERPWK